MEKQNQSKHKTNLKIKLKNVNKKIKNEKCTDGKQTHTNKQMKRKRNLGK